MNINDYKKRESEFREAQAKWIAKRHAEFSKHTKHVRAGAQGVRHPKGVPMDLEVVGHWWSDAIWCGDETLTCFEEFFEVDNIDDMYEMIDDQGAEDSVIDWATRIFNEEFKKQLPELAHVLEG